MTEPTASTVPEIGTEESDARLLAPVADIITHHVVDGLSVLTAPHVGPITAGLVFRVGWADETAPVAGITHLVEHLVLHGQELTDGHSNGQTHELFTLFHVTGQESEVVAYLNGVCAALRDLPIHRLDAERRILRTEAAGRAGGMRRAQAVNRYGAQGRGLAALDEIGLDALTPDQVLTWVSTRFTADNAALWITAEHLPEGLDLSLPRGQRIPAPPTDDLLESKPSYFRGGEGAVLLDAVVPRTTAATVFTSVARKMLYRELRHDGGFSYAVDCDYEPVSAELARVTMFADALPAQQDAVVGGMVDVLAAISAGTVAEEDLPRAREQLSPMAEGDTGAILLPSTTFDLLLGAGAIHPEDLAARRAAVTAEDVAAVARAVRADALAQIPAGSLDWAGFSADPSFSADALSGRAYPRLDDPTMSLVWSGTGVSMRGATGAATVRFDDLVAYQQWPDGARALFGRDGFRVYIEPTLHEGVTADVIAAIDGSVPDSVRISMPSRAQDTIPLLPAGAAAAVAPRKVPGLGRWAIAVGVLLGALSLFLIVLTFVDTMRLGDPGNEDSLADILLEWGIVVALTVGSATLIAASFRRRRWLRIQNDANTRR